MYIIISTRVPGMDLYFVQNSFLTHWSTHTWTVWVGLFVGVVGLCTLPTLLYKRLLNAVQVHCLHANNLSVPKPSVWVAFERLSMPVFESWCMKGIRGVYSLQQKHITKKSQVPGACTSVCPHYSYQHNSIGKWNSDVFKRLFN